MLKFPSPHKKILPADIKLVWPQTESQDSATLDRITGSLIGLAVGDALGASVEFRPHQYLAAHPVHDMMGGGTWGLRAGQWTDDTSMALCLASSLISERGYNSYDQMVRYKWWYRHGYLSSTGHCFDIGNATRNSLDEFQRRQNLLKREFNMRNDADVDHLKIDFLQQVDFDVNCSYDGVAGNGALMRLAPVPLFFYQVPSRAVDLSGQSARLTHGDTVAVDACRYYGALIVAAVRDEPKESLLSKKFYEDHQDWFGSQGLHGDILHIAHGSYKKRGGYKDGIRGKGHIVSALEAALWAFWSTSSFQEGALNAVNLGDDTDTTAAIYGQLAGAYYGLSNIPLKWRNQLYASELIICIAEWLQFLGDSGIKPYDQQIVARGRNQLPSPSHETKAVTATLSTKLSPGNAKKSNPISDKKRSQSATKPKSNKSSMPKCFRAMSPVTKISRSQEKGQDPSSWDKYRHDQYH